MSIKTIVMILLVLIPLLLFLNFVLLKVWPGLTESILGINLDYFLGEENEKTGEGLIIEGANVFVKEFNECLEKKEDDCICGVKLHAKDGYITRLVKDEGDKEISAIFFKGELGGSFGEEIKRFYILQERGGLCVYSEDSDLVESWGRRTGLYGSVLDIDKNTNEIWFLDNMGKKRRFDSKGSLLERLIFYKNRAGDMCLILSEANKLFAEKKNC